MSDDRDDELGETSEKLGGIAGRFGTTETSETSETIDTTPEPSPEMSETTTMTETIETTETPDTNETPQPGDAEFQLREHWNGRTIYLPDDVVDELDIRYGELQLEWRREHGDELPKNERFYPALVRAALSNTSIREELGLDDE